MSRKNKKLHVDYSKLEVEIRKSIKKKEISERLGQYIVKITDGILLTRYYKEKFTKERVDEMRYEVYEYIVRKLLENYDVDRRAGFAFIRSMALNRIKSTKRRIFSEGADQTISHSVYDSTTKVRYTATFLTID